MKDFSKRISALSKEQRALFELRLSRVGSGLSKIGAIPKRPESSFYPLSFGQQRQWFLNQLEPGNPLYNDSLAVCLTGLLNIAALEQSLNEIIRRHEILRTTFPVLNGQPFQSIAPAQPQSLPVVNFNPLPSAYREPKAVLMADKEFQRSFNLTKGSLLRATLLRLSEAEHLLLLTMHHIITDGWSWGVLIRELVTLYKAFSAGKASLLAELPIQYADFAHWQRQWLSGQVLESQLAYWKHQLADAPPVLELPTDRPRPATRSYRGARQFLALSKTLTEELKVLSRRAETTLFMTLLAAFKTLLYRYTGQDDIVVGTDIANRSRTDTEALIGFFVNHLALRTDMSGNPSFWELLGRVREVALGAYAHQDLPFEQLVKKLRTKRDLSHTPLFQVLFDLQNTPMEALKLPGLTLSPLNIDGRTAKFDLSLFISEGSEGLTASLEYDLDLFDASTITRVLKHFQILLEEIVVDPKQRISAVSFLTDTEEEELIDAFQAECGEN